MDLTKQNIIDMGCFWDSHRATGYHFYYGGKPKEKPFIEIFCPYAENYINYIVINRIETSGPVGLFVGYIKDMEELKKTVEKYKNF